VFPHALVLEALSAAGLPIWDRGAPRSLCLGGTRLAPPVQSGRWASPVMGHSFVPVWAPGFQVCVHGGPVGPARACL
jgi:hypothetical protein